MQARTLLWTVSIAACASAPPVVIDRPVRIAPRVVQAPPPPPPAAEEPPAEVAVSGIEGTLTSFDVRTTMEEQSKPFNACQTARRRVPGLAGQVEFGIKVLHDGVVSRVDIRASDSAIASSSAVLLE